MGVTRLSQPPQICWPLTGATDVPTDAWLFGVGGTLVADGPAARGPRYPLPSSIVLSVDGRAVAVTWERIGSFTMGPTPHGYESRAVVCIRPDAPLHPNAEVQLREVLPGGERILTAFRTGTGPATDEPAAPVALPPSDPRVLSMPLPPIPGDARPLRAIAIELPDGPFLVDVGHESHLIVGPGLHVQSAPEGERVRVRDARLRERLELVAE